MLLWADCTWGCAFIVYMYTYMTYINFLETYPNCNHYLPNPYPNFNLSLTLTTDPKICLFLQLDKLSPINWPLVWEVSPKVG